MNGWGGQSSARRRLPTHAFGFATKGRTVVTRPTSRSKDSGARPSRPLPPADDGGTGKLKALGWLNVAAPVTGAPHQPG